MSQDTSSSSPGSPFVVAVGGQGHGFVGALARLVGSAPDPSLVYLVASSTTADAIVLQASAWAAVVATDGMELTGGTVVRIPMGSLVVLEGRRLVLRARAHDEPPVDALFRAVATALGPSSIGVVLSGRGNDGPLGLRSIKEAGGLTFAQLPTEAAEADMPRAGMAAGVVDLVLPVEEIAARALALTSKLAPADDSEGTPTEPLHDILALVRTRSGHDFSAYKRASLLRRITRRMALRRIDTRVEYLRCLREDGAELGQLVRDFMISVTSFFRDPEAFEALDRLVLAPLFADTDATRPVRIWVAGCATGEEAYSLAILCAEHQRRNAVPRPVQIFASDIDLEALSTARAGRYPETIRADVSAERLERSFSREPDGWLRVRKSIRERIVFSPHNLLQDPPFSQLDLATCRNVLIYLNRDAQERALGLFAFGVKRGGHLALGGVETVSPSSAFAAVDAKLRIYVRGDSAAPRIHERLSSAVVPRDLRVLHGTDARERIPSHGELHHRFVEHYAPPSILVDDQLDVVHVSAGAGRFLTIPPGEPTRSLVRILHDDLRLDARAVAYAARQAPGSRHRRTVRMDLDGVATTVTVTATAASFGIATPLLLLMLFEESAASEATDDPPDGAGEAAGDFGNVVKQLEDELAATRATLRATIEHYETAGEELKSSYEELQALNEELQAATEETNTGKEELQSINEEVTTVNVELKENLEELAHANADLDNLMASTELAVLFVDRGMRLKRYTPRARELFNVIPFDVGRPLGHVTHQLAITDLVPSIERVASTLVPLERQVTGNDGRRYLLRVHPYRSREDQVDGAVVILVDVSEQHDAQRALRQSERRFRAALRRAPIVMLGQDASGRFTWGHGFGGPMEIAGLAETDLLPAPEAAAFAALRERAAQAQAAVDDTMTLSLRGEARRYEVGIEPSYADGVLDGWLSTAIDVTANARADRREDERIAAAQLEAPDASSRVAPHVSLGRVSVLAVDDEPEGV